MAMSLKWNRSARTLLYLVCAVAALVSLSAAASAQTIPSDVFKVTYFNNNTAGAPLAFVHVANPGEGALCADVYVFRSNQELTECCSCPISPNGLLSFRVDLAANNPGDGSTKFPVSGSIDIISDSTSCSAAGGPGSTASSPTPAPTLRVWATHVNVDTATDGFSVKETETLDTTLSSGELTELQNVCESFQSGFGDCSKICGGG
jgi:hypothetical protein